MKSLDIKNMVCDRCISTVRGVLEDFGYKVDSVALGKADIIENPDEDELDEIDSRLRENGFELIREGDKALVEQVKAELIKYLQHIQSDENPKKLSEFLAQKLHHNYSYLRSQFSKHEGITIERYLIQLKIERVKELLSYEEKTLSEIAWDLNYSSVQYLSNQFKKVTGETVSSFRKHMDSGNRKSLDAVQ